MNDGAELRRSGHRDDILHCDIAADHGLTACCQAPAGIPPFGRWYIWLEERWERYYLLAWPG